MNLRQIPLTLVLAAAGLTSTALPAGDDWLECIPAAVTPTPPDAGWGNGGCEHGCGAPYCRTWLVDFGVRPGECVPTEKETQCTVGSTTLTIFKYHCQGVVDPSCPTGSQTVCEWELIAGSGSLATVVDCK